jgi:hypothetical protein
MEVAETLYANDSVAASLDEEQDYERRWVATVMTHALERLSAEFANSPKTQLFNGLKPFLTGGIGRPSQEETAARLEMPVGTLRSHLSRLRARYREVLREEVARQWSQRISRVFDLLIFLQPDKNAACPRRSPLKPRGKVCSPPLAGRWSSTPGNRKHRPTRR